jgi:hypothetical protein
VLSNPGATPGALRVSEATQVLATNVQHSGHVFWPDDVDLLTAIAPSRGRLQRYRQITDAYLLGLAIQHKGHLVTLDGGIASLAPLSELNTTRVINLLRQPPLH